MNKAESFEQMGGRKSLEAINKIFCDKVYKRTWLKRYFEKIPQEHIELQQVDFMQKVLGDENLYIGKAPPAAHQHIFVSEELFDVRQKLLKETFKESKASQCMIDKWLNLDQSFKRIIVKAKPEDCMRRFTTDPILDFPNPE
jgi:hemoglobin